MTTLSNFADGPKQETPVRALSKVTGPLRRLPHLSLVLIGLMLCSAAYGAAPQQTGFSRTSDWAPQKEALTRKVNAVSKQYRSRLKLQLDQIHQLTIEASELLQAAIDSVDGPLLSALADLAIKLDKKTEERSELMRLTLESARGRINREEPDGLAPALSRMVGAHVNDGDDDGTRLAFDLMYQAIGLMTGAVSVASVSQTQAYAEALNSATFWIIADGDQTALAEVTSQKNIDVFEGLSPTLLAQTIRARCIRSIMLLFGHRTLEAADELTKLKGSLLAYAAQKTNESSNSRSDTVESIMELSRYAGVSGLTNEFTAAVVSTFDALEAQSRFSDEEISELRAQAAMNLSCADQGAAAYKQIRGAVAAAAKADDADLLSRVREAFGMVALRLGQPAIAQEQLALVHVERWKHVSADIQLLRRRRANDSSSEKRSVREDLDDSYSNNRYVLSRLAWISAINADMSQFEQVENIAFVAYGVSHFDFALEALRHRHTALARTLLERTLDLAAKQGPSPPVLLRAASELAAIYAAEGKTQRAVSVLDRVFGMLPRGAANAVLSEDFGEPAPPYMRAFQYPWELSVSAADEQILELKYARASARLTQYLDLVGALQKAHIGLSAASRHNAIVVAQWLGRSSTAEAAQAAVLKGRLGDERTDAAIRTLQGAMSKMEEVLSKSTPDYGHAVRLQQARLLGQAETPSLGDPPCSPNLRKEWAVKVDPKTLDADNLFATASYQDSQAKIAQLEEHRKLLLTALDQVSRYPAIIDRGGRFLYSGPIDETQTSSYLTAKEMLLYFVTTTDKTYVVGFSKLSQKIVVVPVGRDRLAARIADLRKPIDTPDREPERTIFDLEAAYRMFSDLLGGFNAELRGINRLIVVADGPISNLPFALLITERPRSVASGNLAADAKAYRAARWLDRTFAFSTVPSIKYFVAARLLRDGRDALVQAGNPVATSGFVGYGDPVMSVDEIKQCGEATRSDHGNAKRTPSGSSLLGLCPIPQAARMLSQLARALSDEKGGVIRAGSQANLEIVKTDNDLLSLRHAKFLAFVTHAFLSSETRRISGISEPGILLSPLRGGDMESRIMTTSLISKLNVGAELVFLLGCNTGAGADDFGGQGLSGLAKAFFDAGASGMIVTNWSIYPEPTQLALNLLLKRLKTLKPRIALTETIAEVRGSNGVIPYAHPKFWASLSLVSDQ